MSNAVAIALTIVALVAMLWGMLALAGGVNDCEDFRLEVIPIKSMTGWHEEDGRMVECYEGELIGVRYESR